MLETDKSLNKRQQHYLAFILFSQLDVLVYEKNVVLIFNYQILIFI